MTTQKRKSESDTGAHASPETVDPLAVPPYSPPEPTGDYVEPPVQPAQVPPPAFPDQPDPRDLDHADQDPGEKGEGPRVSER